jgi:hypothetical protein
VVRGGIRDSLSASTFDITARVIRAAMKLRGSYNGCARIVANLQTMLKNLPNTLICHAPAAP